jgi:hypothetical protein
MEGYTLSISFYYKQMHNMSYGSNKISLPQCSNHSNHSGKLSSCKKYTYIPEQMLKNWGTQSLCARLPGQLHFVCDPQYGTHCMPRFWYFIILWWLLDSLRCNWTAYPRLAIKKHISWETVLSFIWLRLTNWINSGVKKIKRTEDGI